ncbi:MAG: DUF983 domain-containing protein [Alphaproteobacteria bacterium]|nr:DUF983 domain-containing protein [Alphaproteobacteria bacterium]
MSPAPISSSLSYAEPDRAMGPAIRRGFGRHCPACGKGPIFGRFLKVNDACGECGTELHHHRADDAPPYFTIFIVGHIVIPLLLLLERQAMPPTWLHMALWLPLTLLLSLWFLPRVKGALIGLQWAKRMHGFGGDHD